MLARCFILTLPLAAGTRPGQVYADHWFVWLRGSDLNRRPLGYEGKSGRQRNRDELTGTNDDEDVRNDDAGAFWFISVDLLHRNFIGSLGHGHRTVPGRPPLSPSPQTETLPEHLDGFARRATVVCEGPTVIRRGSTGSRKRPKHRLTVRHVDNDARRVVQCV